MARYFFSLRKAGRLIPDREGVDLPVGTDIAQCAGYLAQRLRAERSIADLALAGYAVEVSDQTGSHVVTVPVTGD